MSFMTMSQHHPKLKKNPLVIPEKKDMVLICMSHLATMFLLLSFLERKGIQKCKIFGVSSSLNNWSSPTE